MRFFTCTIIMNHFHSPTLALLAIIITNIILVLTTNAKTSLATKIMEENDNFIKNSCGVTIYQEICYKTLSPYAGTIKNDPTQLANAALNLTLKSAKATTRNILNMSRSSDIVIKAKELGAIRDCLENLKDSIGQLQQSLLAMKGLEGPEFEIGMSNIQTWVSAALTDEDTCMDGFEGNGVNGKVRDFVRSCVVRLAMLTSNALALINQLS